MLWCIPSTLDVTQAPHTSMARTTALLLGVGLNSKQQSSLSPLNYTEVFFKGHLFSDIRAVKSIEIRKFLCLSKLSVTSQQFSHMTPMPYEHASLHIRWLDKRYGLWWDYNPFLYFKFHCIYYVSGFTHTIYAPSLLVSPSQKSFHKGRKRFYSNNILVWRKQQGKI